jgi:four helix bundle protein
MIDKAPNRFVAHELALHAAKQVFELVAGVPSPYADLAAQARRAAASVPLNLAEGAGRAGRDRTHHFRIAYGSLKETESAIRLLASLGGVDSKESELTLATIDRVGAAIWRLIARPGC